jgi:uncharacterized protein (DUF1501 family)
MNRRNFIRNTGLAALSPFILNSLWSCSTRKKAKRIFVIIQLDGGNDGLNTLIPLDNYQLLANARPNLLIPEKKLLSLKGITATALHPALEGIRDMYNDNLISFVQGVGYDNQSYSHFRSSDIWLTGSDAATVLHTGWAARYLQTRYKNYPASFPNSEHPEPPAIKIGDTGTYLFQGDEMDMSIVIDPIEGFETHDVDASSSELTGMAGRETKSIRDLLLQAERYSNVIKDALAVSFNHSKLYPETGKNPLADQLKKVAQLIHGGLQTSVYLVDLKGFDTHNSQVDSSDHSKGIHSDLLGKLSQGITCFWDDIKRMGKENEVAGMTFSEFGRRIMSNGSYGTDHGSSQPLLFFGSQIKSGITGTNPLIPEKVTVNDNLSLQYDYRSVYASILNGWFKAPSNTVAEILDGNFPEIEIFKS